MEIRINTDESGPDEFTALIALFASLGGRLPDQPRSIGKIAELAAGYTPNAETRGPVATPTREDDEREAPTMPINDSAVDSKGTPWDARIHSESKATVADGTWRKRRGVSDELFNEVMAELTAAASNDDAGEDEAPPPPPADDDSGNAQASSEDVPAPPAPTEDKPSDPAPAANAPAAGDAGGQFADFPAFVGAVGKHGKTYAELNEMAGMLGVPMFKDMKDHPDKWDMFFSMIG